MWKKTFIRSTLIILVVLAGIFVFTTAAHTKKPAGEDCIKSGKDCCNKNKSQSDFMIWESLSRAIVANAQF
jgi:hypothetical protein